MSLRHFAKQPLTTRRSPSSRYQGSSRPPLSNEPICGNHLLSLYNVRFRHARFQLRKTEQAVLQSRKAEGCSATPKFLGRISALVRSRGAKRGRECGVRGGGALQMWEGSISDRMAHASQTPLPFSYPVNTAWTA